MIKILLLLLPLLLGASQIEHFKQTLQKLQKEATKTKENIFYRPYIVSVYKGEDLEKIGVTRLDEALQLVPGLIINADNLDMETAIFRGSNPYAYGQTKLFIDGVCVNDVAFDQYSNYLRMPIELVKRIEIIRGPGNKSDDLNFYAGAIYVYTYAECECTKARYFFKKGSDNLTTLGFMKNMAFGEDLRLYLEGYLDRDDRSVPSGKDILSTGYFGDVNKPLSRSGEAPLWLKDYSLAATLSYKGLSIQLRDLYYKHGMAYGLSYILPHKEDFYRLPSRIAQIKYQHQLSPSATVEIKGGLKFDSFYTRSHLAPPGIVYLEPFTQKPVVFKEGIYGIYEAKQRTLFTALKISHELEDQTIRYGTYVAKTKTYSVTTKMTDRSGRSDKIVDYSDTLPFIDPHARRYQVIFYAEDEYQLSDALSLMAGVNFEKNDNTKGEPEPRLAFVYKADPDTIYKLSYSRSHRNPSWQELFTINNRTRVGNKDLKPERVSALEASLIKRGGVDEYYQATLFYLRNSNIINNINAQHRFVNRSSIRLYGLELETKKMLTPSLLFYGNYSFVKGECSCHHEVPNVPRHMLKFYLRAFLAPWMNLTAHYQYVSDRKRDHYDSRGKLKGYQRVDLALDLQFSSSFEATLALKNLLGEDIYYPAPPNTYQDDYLAMNTPAVSISLRWSY